MSRAVQHSAALLMFSRS